MISLRERIFEKKKMKKKNGLCTFCGLVLPRVLTDIISNIILWKIQSNTHVVFVVAHAVHPKAHGHAYEHCARGDQTDADVPDGRHGFRVMIGQAEPVEQGADAHQRHAEPVRPLRFFRDDQRHFRVCGLGDRVVVSSPSTSTAALAP